jgi:hypothetical protein
MLPKSWQFAITSSNHCRYTAERLLAVRAAHSLWAIYAAFIAMSVSAAPNFGTRPTISPVAAPGLSNLPF